MVRKKEWVFHNPHSLSTVLRKLSTENGVLDRRGRLLEPFIWGYAEILADEKALETPE